jgi:D-arabinose 1-dehydrogenase-like Zn-dependent alcohol dehydrogenase
MNLSINDHRNAWLPKSQILRANCNGQIPTTMRAVVYHGINDMRVETVPVPRIGPGELLVKIATCGICGTDLKKIHLGSHSAPRIFGHEMAGTIVAVGRRRHWLSVGDRVMTFHHVPCGECYYCRRTRPRSARSIRRPASPRASSPPAAALPSTSA